MDFLYNSGREMHTLHDTPNSDIGFVDTMADMSEEFGLFDYVRIDETRPPRAASEGAEKPRPWIGQILETNRNISIVGGDRLSPVILHGLKLMQENADVRAVESVQIYKIKLLGIDNGRFLITPRVRPLPGALVKKLDAENTIRILRLPKVEKVGDKLVNVIGVLPNAENVALPVNDKIVRHHIMVSGGTGSGKSNVSANLVHQAVRMGKCVLIHDAKPDYQLIREKNTDPGIRPEDWDAVKKYGVTPAGAKDVMKIGFKGVCNEAAVDKVVTFRASDFSPDMLAGFFFPDRRDVNMFEGFAAAASSLVGSRSYSINDILKRVEEMGDSDNLHKATSKAIARKAKNRKERMPWLDAVAKSSSGINAPTLQGMPQPPAPFSPDWMKSGHVLVVDYSQMDDEAYALILSYFLRVCHEFRRRQRGKFGVVQLIDEAHHIFDNRSVHSDVLGLHFARTMREGRTLDHSIIISLQSASQVPGHVMTNLNTRFVMRQNSRHDADAAAEKMGKEYALRSMQLGTGDALASVFESEAVVLARMFPSPYELMRTDNSGGVDTR